MISGMYMGELVRLVLQKFTKEGLLFGGKGSDMLFERGRFYTKYVSEIETDPPGVFNSLREICEELGKNILQLQFNYYTNLHDLCNILFYFTSGFKENAHSVIFFSIKINNIIKC